MSLQLSREIGPWSHKMSRRQTRTSGRYRTMPGQEDTLSQEWAQTNGALRRDATTHWPQHSLSGTWKNNTTHIRNILFFDTIHIQHTHRQHIHTIPSTHPLVRKWQCYCQTLELMSNFTNHTETPHPTSGTCTDSFSGEKKRETISGFGGLSLMAFMEELGVELREQTGEKRAATHFHPTPVYCCLVRQCNFYYQKLRQSALYQTFIL